MTDSRFDLEKLPEDILKNEIPPQATIQTLSRLAQCNKHLNKLFQPKVSAAKLLRLVLRGDQDEAEKILKANPALLYEKTKATDYSGRTFYCSPFQAALGAGDIWMLKMMQSIIESSQTQTTALLQYKEQCETPDNRKAMMLAQLEKDLKALEAAISQDPCTKGQYGGEPTTQLAKDAIKNFQNHLDATSKEMIKTGEHFPLEMMTAIYKVYKKNWDNNAWDGNQLSCYSVDVISYALRFAPAVDAQWFRKGLVNEVSVNDALPRSFDLGKGRKYFPLDVDPTFIIGRSHLVDCYYGRACAWGVAAVRGGGVAGPA